MRQICASLIFALIAAAGWSQDLAIVHVKVYVSPTSAPISDGAVVIRKGKGNIGAVYLSALLFVAANLTVGITLCSLAQNQLQAVQLTVFYFLPNILLSGFMFPFQGMPRWAQMLGDLLPLTFFNRLIRGILLKGNGWADSWPSVWPLMAFTLVVMTIAIRTYRRTLD